VTLFDTADDYGDGRSESLIGQFLAGRSGHGITVATKMGRRVDQVPENYTPENFRAWTDRSRRNLGVDTLDLVQLHCPPTAVVEDDATYEALDALVVDGAIAAYGVSVETCAQALAVIAHPGVTNVQIILNPFRLKPLDEVLPAAQAAGVAIFARVPLASGLLSGKYTAQTTFAPDDHRTFNRHGEAFDRGETFSGVDFETGLDAARELAAALPDGVSLPAASLAWIASRPGVTAVIPGARSVAQATANAEAGTLLDGGLDLDAFDAVVHEVYDRRLRADIHPLW
jgi:aryl-alcohol dehydrogenase-like predicted oxidoreductase